MLHSYQKERTAHLHSPTEFPHRPIERANVIAPKTSNEKAQFENDVLPGPLFLALERRVRKSASIICREKNHCERHVRVVHELLNDCPPLIRQFMQDDGVKLEFFQEPRDAIPESPIPTMDNEDLL